MPVCARSASTASSAVTRTGAAVIRPDGFDLDAAWRLIADEVDQRRAPLRVRARATPGVLQLLRWVLGTRVWIGPTGTDGRIEVEFRGSNVESIAGEIAGFGSDVEVLEPEEVRDQLARIGRELTTYYAPSAHAAGSEAP